MDTCCFFVPDSRLALACGPQVQTANYLPVALCFFAKNLFETAKKGKSHKYHGPVVDHAKHGLRRRTKLNILFMLGVFLVIYRRFDTKADERLRLELTTCFVLLLATSGHFVTVFLKEIGPIICFSIEAAVQFWDSELATKMLSIVIMFGVKLF